MKSFLRRFALASGRALLTLVIVAAALVAGRYLWAYYQEARGRGTAGCAPTW